MELQESDAQGFSYPSLLTVSLKVFPNSDAHPHRQIMGACAALVCARARVCAHLHLLVRTMVGLTSRHLTSPHPTPPTSPVRHLTRILDRDRERDRGDLPVLSGRGRGERGIGAGDGWVGGWRGSDGYSEGSSPTGLSERQERQGQGHDLEEEGEAEGGQGGSHAHAHAHTRPASAASSVQREVQPFSSNGSSGGVSGSSPVCTQSLACVDRCVRACLLLCLCCSGCA